MAAPAPATAWAARGTSLASTSGRHAAPLVPLQQGAAAPSRRRLGSSQRAQALSYDGRPAVGPATSPRPFGAAGMPSRLPPGMSPQQLAAQQLAAQQLRGPNAQQPLAEQQAAGAAAQQQGAANSAAAAEYKEPPLDEHEKRRRQKISAANKGRVPWNKGRKHPPEVIARIKAATQKAMQRPDVKARLAKANEKREPHTDEAKEKIRVKLLERANVAREEINRQAEIILRERLAASEDPAVSQLAALPQAHEVVAGLAWQYFKKDWTEVASRGWDEHPDFRERCISKLQRMADKRSGEPRKRKVDKVKAALGHLKKLEEARAKLGAAEEAVTKLRRAKVAFAGDPARLAAATAAEDKATQLLPKLREQVEKLEKALHPLEEYLEQASSASVAPPSAQQHQDLEQRLEAAAAQQAERAQQLAAGGEAAANAAAVSGGFSNGTALSGLNGSGELHGAANGHAAAVPAAASPARAALPWQS